MKKFIAFAVVLFLSVNWVLAQDTLYIYKGGVVVAKRLVTDIDSITFYRQYDTPAIINSLTGGVGVKKTWVLDIGSVGTTTIDDAGVTTKTNEYKSLYFHNPVDFYGDTEAGAANGLSWGPWGGFNLYEWGQTPELGEISFDAGTGIATSTIDGITKSGKYSFNTYNRDPNFCILTSEGYGGQTLWNNMLTGKYSYLGSLSPEMGTMHFASGMRFPLDRNRMTNDGSTTYPCQFLTNDLENLTIMHCSDSALIVREKRSYEGDTRSTVWLLYNYRVKEYTYPKASVSVVHPVKSITASDLVGEWQLADVPGNWIDWITKKELNTWTDGAAMNAAFVDWYITNTAEKQAAYRKVALRFEANGNCTITNVTFDTNVLQETTSTVNTTYSVANGYITFGQAVAISAYTDLITLVGKNIYALDVTGTTSGLWIGQNDGARKESIAVHLIKK